MGCEMIAHILAIIFLLKLGSKTHLNAPSFKLYIEFLTGESSSTSVYSLLSLVRRMAVRNF